jgi:hypothetical protein
MLVVCAVPSTDVTIAIGIPFMAMRLPMPMITVIAIVLVVAVAIALRDGHSRGECKPDHSGSGKAVTHF